MVKLGYEIFETVLDDGGPFTLWLDEEHVRPRRGVVFTTLFCNNPKCPCRELRINASFIDDRMICIRLKGGKLSFRVRKGEADQSPVLHKEFSASVNVDTGKVSFISGISRESDPELSALFVAKLKGMPLEIMRRRWRVARRCTDRLRWRSLDWSWWDPGVTISWSAVFADDLNIIFKWGRSRFWANDMYCIDPGCPCWTAVIAFYRIDDRGKTEHVGAVTVRLDKWQMEEPGSADGRERRLQSLWDTLRKMPYLKNTLKERYRELRSIGAEIAHISAAGKEGGIVEAPSPRARPGPKNLCPCGSGRRHRKSCLGREPLSG